MTIRPAGIVVFIAFLVVFGLLLGAGRSGDLFIRGVIWAGVSLASGWATVRLLRGQPHTTDCTIGLPDAVRRWLIGEAGKR